MYLRTFVDHGGYYHLDQWDLKKEALELILCKSIVSSKVQHTARNAFSEVEFIGNKYVTLTKLLQNSSNENIVGKS